MGKVIQIADYKSEKLNAADQARQDAIYHLQQAACYVSKCDNSSEKIVWMIEDCASALGEFNLDQCSIANEDLF